MDEDDNVERNSARSNTVFELETIDNTVVLTPTENMGELNSEVIAKGLRAAQDQLKGTEFKNVVLDFERTDYFGSTVINEFIHLWKDVRTRDGQMALCGLSPHEKVILEATKLDSRWLICASRDEALERVQEAGGN